MSDHIEPALEPKITVNIFAKNSKMLGERISLFSSKIIHSPPYLSFFCLKLSKNNLNDILLIPLTPNFTHKKYQKTRSSP